jgi:hypothetical protein
LSPEVLKTKSHASPIGHLKKVSSFQEISDTAKEEIQKQNFLIYKQVSTLLKECTIKATIPKTQHITINEFEYTVTV